VIDFIELEKRLKRFKDTEGRLTVLTGAGISAESGIPTFRGPEGYWTVGSKEYRYDGETSYTQSSSGNQRKSQWASASQIN